MTRGKILRDTSAGDGTIFIDGRQVQFSLEKNWRSGVPPKAGMVVDVELSPDGTVGSVTHVEDAVLAKEQAQKTLKTLSTQGRKAAEVLVARVGISTLVAVAVLFISWLFLNTLSMQVGAGRSIGISLYDILKMANSDFGMQALGMLETTSAGFYGLLMWICLLLPIAPHLHAYRHLVWGYCAPLVFMLVSLSSLYFQIKSKLSQGLGMASGMSGMFGGERSADIAQKMVADAVSQLMSSISLGLGFYVGLLAASYLAFAGIKKILAQRSLESAAISI